MARPTNVNERAVREAMLALMVAGESVTIGSVRTALGGTGSPNTITRHMKATLTKLAKQAQGDLPATLPPALDEPLEQFWTAACEQARDYVGKASDKLRAETEQARRDADRAKGQAAEAQGRVDGLRDRLAEVEDALEVQTAECRLASGAADKAEREALAAQESEKHTQTRCKKEIDDMEKQMSEQVETLRQEMAGKEAYFAERESQLMVEIDSLREKNALASKDLTASDAELRDLRKELSETEKQARIESRRLNQERVALEEKLALAEKKTAKKH